MLSGWVEGARNAGGIGLELGRVRGMWRLHIRMGFSANYSVLSRQAPPFGSLFLFLVFRRTSRRSPESRAGSCCHDTRSLDRETSRMAVVIQYGSMETSLTQKRPSCQVVWAWFDDWRFDIAAWMLADILSGKWAKGCWITPAVVAAGSPLLELLEHPLQIGAGIVKRHERRCFLLAGEVPQ